MAECGRQLDDDSPTFLTRLRAEGLLTDDDWMQIRIWLREAGWQQDAPLEDPRNEWWLRVLDACDRAGHVLPGWAALWLWRLHGRDDSQFWRRVGEIVAELGDKRDE